MDDAPHAITPDCFTLENCPNCAYALTGLPPTGTCPECGEHYDTETIELPGVAHGSHVNAINASDSHFYKRMLPSMAFFATLLGVWIYSVVLTGGQSASNIMLVITFTVLWVVPITNIGRRCFGEKCVSRLRMNFAGIVQDDDPNEPAWVAIVRVSAPYVQTIGMILIFIFVSVTGHWIYLAVGALFIYGPIGRWLRNRRARRAILAAPDGNRLTRLDRRSVLIPCHWANVSQIEISAIDDERCRIVAACQTTVTTAGESDICDIEVRCTPAQATDLRTRIHAWREYWRNVDQRVSLPTKLGRRLSAIRSGR